MTSKNLLAASFGALFVVACGGGGSDHSDVDKSKLPPPPKDAYCVSMGDKCQLVDNRWVVRPERKKPTPKDPKDKPPLVDPVFDYADIGTTDRLTSEIRGMAFYAKGTKSPLDKNAFETKVTQSPIIGWSSVRRYDVDLYNFVAVRLSDGDDAKDKGGDADKQEGKEEGAGVDKDKYAKKKKTAPKKLLKFAFDKIGEHNQEVNPNSEFFGMGKDADKFDVAKGIGASTLKNGVYERLKLPAVVNTMIWMNAEGKFIRDHIDDKNGVFYHQEEDVSSPIGSGAVNSRVYGVNSFLLDVAGADRSLVLDPETAKPGDTNIGHIELTNRPLKFLRHVNFVYYDWKPARRNVSMNATNLPLELYDGEKKRFPTDVDFGELKNVQFGRLTGEGLSRAEPIPGYKDPALLSYPFSENVPAISDNAAREGNPSSEDWYFARGTTPSPRSVIDRLKTNSQGDVIYRGQALMFGLNYDVKPGKPKEGSETISTNSVLPTSNGNYGPWSTLLDGKQNFVSLRWNPGQGTVKGSVFGVWTKAIFLRANKDFDEGSTSYKKGEILPLAWDPVKHKAKLGTGPGKTPEKVEDYFGATGLVSKMAINLSPFRNPLVELDGHISPKGNSFRGQATRCATKDCAKGEKGTFVGAFFGEDASEVAGTIDSQTGSLRDRKLKNPASKWGGVFGARSTPGLDEFDILDKEYNYSTSTEYF